MLDPRTSTLWAAALSWTLGACEAPREPEARCPDDGAWLEDVTARSGIAMTHAPAEGYATLSDRLGGGVCALDLDGAPPADLFFAARAGGSRLYVASAPLAYVDATASVPGLGALDAIGCLVLDADEDGDDDLLVTGVGVVSLFLAQGDATGFVDASAGLGARPAPADVMTSAAAGDVDGDGHLDLVVAGFADVRALDPGDCGGVPCAVLVGRHPAIPNLFLRGRGDGTFADASAEAGPLGLLEPTLAVAIAPLDDDGGLDVYVGNDSGDFVHDHALVWDGSALVDASDRIGLAYDSRGHGIDTMGFTAGDVDGDLRLDFSVSAFEGYPSPIFVCGADDWCEDRGRELGMVARADSFRWGNALVDLDLDGALDLFEATGHVYLDAEGAALGFPTPHEQPANLFRGARGPFTAVVPSAADALAAPHAGRGLTVLDLDGDARPDLVTTTSRGAPVLLRSVRPACGRPLAVMLRGLGEPSAIGARVVLRAGAFSAVRTRLDGEGFLGSFEGRLFFAVPADAAARVRLEVVWPSGTTSTHEVPADARELEVVEPPP